MNQKATKQQMAFPPLYNFSKNGPWVDSEFRSAEEINAPYLNEMLQPVWTKDTGYRSVYDYKGNKYELRLVQASPTPVYGFYKNGVRINSVNYSSQALKKEKFDLSQYSGEILSVSVESDNRIAVLHKVDNTVYLNNVQLKVFSGTIIESRVRLINNVPISVIVYDYTGTERLLIFRDTFQMYNSDLIWRKQSKGGSISADSTPVGGAAPCIHISKPSGNFYFVSLTQKAGTVNDLITGTKFATFVLGMSGSWIRELGNGLSLYNSDSYGGGERQTDSVYLNSSVSKASSSVKVVTEDYIDYYYYSQGATSVDQLSQCTYIPSGYGKNYKIGTQNLKIGESTYSFDILSFTLYTKTCNYWATGSTERRYKITHLAVGLANTAVNDDGVNSGNPITYSHQMPQLGVNTTITGSREADGYTFFYFANSSISGTNGKATVSFTYRWLSGQNEPQFILGPNDTNYRIVYVWTYNQDGTEWYSGLPYHSISVDLIDTGSADHQEKLVTYSQLPYSYLPVVCLDNGVFYTLFRLPVQTNRGSDSNPWTSTCQVLGPIMYQAGAYSLVDSNTKIQFQGYSNDTNRAPYIRGGSVAIDQNFYAITLKFNNGQAQVPNSLNNGAVETPSSRFIEWTYDTTSKTLTYGPGTSRLTSFNYYSYAVNDDGSLAGPGEDYAIFTVNGHRSNLSSYGNINWNILHNVTTAGTAFVQGISLSTTDSHMGTLVTPWQSIDESSYISAWKNNVVYKDKEGNWMRVYVANEAPKLEAILEGKLIVFNTVSQENCYDVDNEIFTHYANDYNGRLRRGSVNAKSWLGALYTSSNTWGAFSYIRYAADGINPLYYIMPKDKITSMLLPIVARYRCYVGKEVSIGTAYTSSLDNFKPLKIDVFFSDLSSTACKYRFSINQVYNNGHHTDTIVNHSLQGLVYPGTVTTTASLTPNIFTKYVDGAGNNDLVIDGFDSYVLTYYDNEPYLLYSAATKASNVYSEDDSFFVLQGQFYGIIGDKLYSLSYSNGAISQMDAIIDLGAISFIGNNPMIAFFWDPASRTIRSFTGDANLDSIYNASKYTNISPNRHWYDKTTQSIFVDTDKGLLVFGPRNTYLLDNFQNVTSVQFSDDGVTHIMTDDNQTHDMKYYSDEGYTVLPLKMETSFYGLGANEYTNIDRWDITVFNPEGIENAKLKATVRSLTDISVTSEEKEFKITKDMYDKFTDAVLIRWVPKLQKGQGLRIKIETPLTIQKIVPHVADMGTGTTTRRGM